MPRKQKKYHYIYKTTCLVTSKFYVGMHSTDNLEDGYLGSGKILGYSRNKYGDENHIKEILHFCSSRQELKMKEKEIVNEDLLKDPLNINIQYGGEGGGGLRNEDHTRKFHKGGQLALAVARINNPEKYRDIDAAAAKLRWERYPEKYLQMSRTSILNATKFAWTDKAREKRQNKRKENLFQQGANNSQFGTKWAWVIKEDLKPKKIPLSDLPDYLRCGYVRGKTVK